MADEDLLITPPEPSPAIGAVFGKWRVTRTYEFEGEPWAEIVNTRNPVVKSRCPVSNLASLEIA